MHIDTYIFGDTVLSVKFNINNGTHSVVEITCNNKVVFEGCYKDCLKYCEDRDIGYLESLL